MKGARFILRIYIVQKGDTLQKIAKANHVSVEEIMEYNPHISNADYIMPGMKIKIPSQSIEHKVENREYDKGVSDSDLYARTAERPLGKLDEYDDWEMNGERIPLRKNDYGRGLSNYHSMDKNMSQSFEKKGKHNSREPKEDSQFKTYSDKQYKYSQFNHDGQYDYMNQEHFNRHGPFLPMPPYGQMQHHHHCPWHQYNWHMHHSMQPRTHIPHMGQMPPMSQSDSLSQTGPMQPMLPSSPMYPMSPMSPMHQMPPTAPMQRMSPMTQTRRMQPMSQSSPEQPMAPKYSSHQTKYDSRRE